MAEAAVGTRLSAREAATVSFHALPARMFDALASLPHVPNEEKSKRRREAHWLPVVDASSRKLQKPRTFVEQVVQYIYQHVIPFDLPGLRGVEWWTHSRHPLEKMHFHLDRDEHLWENDRVMKHPTVSSIFYITDVGGPTLVVNQRYGGDDDYDPAEPSEGYLYEPEGNSFATFSGDLLHGVLPSGRMQERLPDLDFGLDSTEEDLQEGRRRITLLMNWWCEDVTDVDGSLSASFSQEEQWAYGSINSKLKWAQPNKRMRRDEPISLREDVQKLYSYNLRVDDSSSDDSDEEC